MYRILIVDDESLIRQSVIKKVEKSPIAFTQIEQAESVEEALRHTQLVVFDIIVCDIRLGKNNGLDFLSVVHKKTSHTQFIVLSGHSEFSYAKTAIALSVVEYLLKPVNTATFYDALTRCIQQLKVQASTTSMQAVARTKEYNNALRLQFLEGITTRNFSLAQYLPLAHLQDMCRVQALVFSPKPFSTELDIIENCFVTQNVWTIQQNCLVFQQSDHIINVIFCCTSAQKELVNTQVNTIANALIAQGIFQFSIGVSDPETALYIAYESALCAVQNRIFLEDNTIIPYEHRTSIQTAYTLPGGRLSYYKLLLQTIDYKLICSFYQQLLTELSTIQHLKYASVQILYNTLRDEILRAFPELFQGRPFVAYVYFFNSIADMFEYLKKKCLYIAEHEAQDESRNWLILMLNSVKSSIEQHYSENLLLEDFAQQHHVSASFLSNQFSQQFGISYQDFLSNTRIEHAQEMLKSGLYTVNQVSQICGFSNQHYFSKVFKKKVGITPSTYKQSATT